jgi:hypothetical protein
MPFHFLNKNSDPSKTRSLEFTNSPRFQRVSNSVNSPYQDAHFVKKNFQIFVTSVQGHLLNNYFVFSCLNFECYRSILLA